MLEELQPPAEDAGLLSLVSDQARGQKTLDSCCQAREKLTTVSFTVEFGIFLCS